MSNTLTLTIAATCLALTSAVSAVGKNPGVINKLPCIQNTFNLPRGIEPPRDEFTITHLQQDTSYSERFLKSLSRLPVDLFLQERVDMATRNGKKVNALEFLNCLLKPIEITFYKTNDNQALNKLLEGYFVRLEKDYNKHLDKIRPQVTEEYLGTGPSVTDQVQNIVNEIQKFDPAITFTKYAMTNAIAGNRLPLIYASTTDANMFKITVVYKN